MKIPKYSKRKNLRLAILNLANSKHRFYIAPEILLMGHAKIAEV